MAPKLDEIEWHRNPNIYARTYTRWADHKHGRAIVRIWGRADDLYEIEILDPVKGITRYGILDALTAQCVLHELIP